MASGRSSVEYWPKDEAWRQVPLEGRRKLGFKLQPICNAFQHRGEIMQIDEFVLPALQRPALHACPACPDAITLPGLQLTGWILLLVGPQVAGAHGTMILEGIMSNRDFEARMSGRMMLTALLSV